MRKCLIANTRMILEEDSAGIAGGIASGALIALYKICRQLEYEIILLHPEARASAENTSRLRAFLEAQDIPVTRLAAIERLEDMVILFGDGLYDLKRSAGVTTDPAIREVLTAHGFLLLPQMPSENFDWHTAYDLLKPVSRKIQLGRKTGETDISLVLNLDGEGRSEIDTGLGFFDHMLEQISRHSGIDLSIRVRGDLQVDEHHTIEDTGLAIGEALLQALGRKTGIERYGFFLPMDESVCRVALDFSGRPQLVWKVTFTREKIGDVPTELFEHFFKSVSDTAKCNLYIEAEGENEHHKIEAVFKAFARSLKRAVRKDYDNPDIPSTKGAL